jgi:hypothetical protein
MTSQTKGNGAEPGVAKSLLPHRKQFLHSLSKQGYAPATLRIYDAAIARFCAASELRAVGAQDLYQQQIERIRAAVLDGVVPRIRTNTKFCVNRFIDHLVEVGIARLLEPPPRVLTALDRLREEYERYLRNQRGLSEATIYHCLRFLGRFMAFRFGETLGDLNAVTPAKSVPRVAQPTPVTLPRYLKPEEVTRLIDAVRTDDPIGRRNHAMLLLMARLGLRSPEVIAIRVEDIDWRAGEIMIRGKGKLHDRMPLPADVGEAIVDYIRNGRAGSWPSSLLSDLIALGACSQLLRLRSVCSCNGRHNLVPQIPTPGPLDSAWCACLQPGSKASIHVPRSRRRASFAESYGARGPTSTPRIKLPAL